MKFLPALLVAALLITGCEKKSTTSTTIDSTGGVVEIPNNSGSDEPSGDPGSTDPGPSQSDGSVPGTGPNDNPVGNPPDGNPPKQPPATPSGNITVSSPQSGDYVNANGFTITGLARTFENNVVYRVTDQATKKVLASGFGTATGEMGKFSPYTINVKPNKVAGVQYPTRALIEVFENSAKDGAEINKVQVPVRMGVGADEPNVVEVFFSNAKKGTSNNCDLVFSLPRSIPQTQALATIALQRLLAGPTVEERAQGYTSQIPAGTKLNKIVVRRGLATADFSSELNTAAGACRVTAIRAQIERTLRQFSTVDRVVITVNGKGDALQP